MNGAGALVERRQIWWRCWGKKEAGPWCHRVRWRGKAGQAWTISEFAATQLSHINGRDSWAGKSQVHHMVHSGKGHWLVPQKCINSDRHGDHGGQ